MSTLQFYHTYEITKKIVTRSNFLNDSINKLNPSTKYFAGVSCNNGVIKLLDVGSYISKQPNVELSTKVSDYLSVNLTELYIDGLPLYTSKKIQRPYCFDPSTIGSFDIWYGTVEKPTDKVGDTLNRLHSRDVLIKTDDTINNNNALVAINGVFHPTVSLEQNIIGVIDGYTNIKRSYQTNMVLMDTTPIGGHEIIQLDESNFFNIGINSTSIYLSVNKDLSDYTPLLMIDGTLYTPYHELYRIINKNTLVIHRDKLDVITPFINNPNLRRNSADSPIINVNSPIYPTLSNDPDFDLFISKKMISKEKLDNNDFLLRRLTSTLSYLVLIKNNSIYFKPHELYTEKETRTCQYMGPSYPRGLMYYNGYHQIPYTVLKNIKYRPENNNSSLYNTMFQNTFMFYINPVYNSDNTFNTSIDTGICYPPIDVCKNFQDSSMYLLEFLTYV